MTDWVRRSNTRKLREVRSGDYGVRVYVDRLAIYRLDGERLTWEEVQRVKTEFWGDKAAIEVYPADAEVINLRHTRHLWSTTDIEDTVNLCCVHPEFHNEVMMSDSDKGENND